MTARLPLPAKSATRKIKAHRKSRQGCGNCKLRKVKCDENKPSCKICIAFRLVCDFESKNLDLQITAGDTFKVGTLQIVPKSRSPSISPALGQPAKGFIDCNDVYQLGLQDLELLCKFQARTILTVSAGKAYRTYNDELPSAGSHPFFLHAVLTMTLMHDRFLSTAPHDRLTTTEAFHWYKGVALLRKKLSGPTQPSELDALWATGALLSTIAFHYIDAKTPEEAWPLKASSSSDLSWLGICGGKRKVLANTQPLLDNASEPLATGSTLTLPLLSMAPGLEALPPAFLTLCALDQWSTPDCNPYYNAASALGLAMNTDDVLSTILNFWSFINTMRPEFRDLLAQKDPLALLILSYWYAKACLGQHWWISQRAALEGQAICVYLTRYYGMDPDIQELIQFPTIACAQLPS